MEKCPRCGKGDLQKIDAGALLGRGAIVGCLNCDSLYEQMNMALGEKNKEWEWVGACSELVPRVAV